MSATAYSLPKRIAVGCCAAAAITWAAWTRTEAQQQPVKSDAPPAVAAASVNAKGLPQPATLLAEASARLAARRSVVAKVRHRAKLYGRDLIGSGDYAQGPNHSRLLRYELRLQVDDRVVNQLQVCDGRYLWISRLLESEPEIQRIEVDRIVAAEAAQAPQPGLGAPTAIALGGLGQVLDALRKDFDFKVIFASQLGDVPVYAVVGHWKPAALEKLPRRDEPPIGLDVELDATGLRLHVPTHVVVYLGVDDLFPYRLEYRRAAGGIADVTARAATALDDDASPRLLVQEYFEVQFDVPLEERLFQFAPGSRRYADITDLFALKRKLVP